MRRIAKVDSNQPAIVKAVRQIGCTVQTLHTIGMGCPDILVGVNGLNLLWEIKDGSLSPSRRQLTADELEWHESWRGHVQIIESVDHALRTINHYRRDK